MDTNRFVKEFVTIADNNNGDTILCLSQTQRFLHSDLENAYCRINEAGQFIVDYHGQRLVIENDCLVFVLPFEGEVARALNKYGNWELISNKGERVSQTDYSFIYSFKYGNAIVSCDKGCSHYYGVIRDNGSIAVEPKFCFLVREGHYFRYSDGVLDSNGHFLIGDAMLDSKDYDSCILWSDDFILLKHNGKYGIASKNGVLLVECIYDDIEHKEQPYNILERYSKKKDSSYSRIGKPKNGYIFCRDVNTASSYIVSSKGDIKYLSFDVVDAIYYEGGFLAVKDRDGNWSLENDTGDFLLSSGRDAIEIVKYGFVITRSKFVYNLQGALIYTPNHSSNGTPLGEFSFDDIHRTLAVRDYLGQQRFDNNGRLVSLMGESMYYLDSCYLAGGDFHDGLAAVARKGKKPIVVNLPLDEHYQYKHLNSVFLKDISGSARNEYLINIKSQVEYGHKDVVDLAAKETTNSLIWGYIDITGREVIPCQFSLASDFSCGVARIKYKDYYGFINAAGTYSIPRRFRIVSAFSEGYAVAQGRNLRKRKDTRDFFKCQGSIWYLIDPKGRIVRNYEAYEMVGPLSCGLLLAKRFGHYGYLDIDGNEVIPFIFKKASPFINHLATVVFSQDESKEYQIDTKGNIVVTIENHQYHIPVNLQDFYSLGDWNDGKAILCVRENRKGLISINGEMVLPPMFETIIYEKRIKRWVVDLDSIVLELSDQGYLEDELGNPIVIDNYISFTHLIDSLFVAKKNCCYGVVTNNGEVVIPFDYDDIELYKDKKHILCSKRKKKDNSFSRTMIVYYKVFDMSGKASTDIDGWTEERDYEGFMP